MRVRSPSVPPDTIGNHMQVRKELELWFINKIRELVLAGYKDSKSNNFYDGPEESLYEYYQGFTYLAVHLTEHKGYLASSEWFTQNGCKIPGYEREKHHLMARIRDNSIRYKDIFS